MSELARVLAYAARMQGKDRMTKTELKQLLSLRLNWYPPAQATQLVEKALRAGLLTEEGEVVRLAFDPAALELPLDFRGTARALEEDAAPPLDPTLVERAQALREAAREALTEEVALLLARRERGEDVRAEAARQLAALGGAPSQTGPKAT